MDQGELVNTPQIQRAATELILHRLTNRTPGAIYDEITRVCPAGISDLMAVTIHLADAMAAALIKDAGSPEAAAETLLQQLSEPGDAGGLE